MTKRLGWLRVWQRWVWWAGVVFVLCTTMPVLAQPVAQSPVPSLGNQAPLPADSSSPGAAISLRDDRLSLDLRNQQLHTVLRSIAQQGAIDIRHLEGVPNTPLSLSFSALPVVTGLQRLFRAAAVQSYVLVTAKDRDRVRVKRILFFTDVPQTRTGRVSRERRRPARRSVAPPPARTSAASSDEKSEEKEESDSVFDDIKANTAARRLLSQLVHPNEQVRDRALERLVRLIDDDSKQVELLEFLEPLLEDLGSEDRQEREEARREIRKLLRR